MSERALRGVLERLYPDDAALGGRALANRRRAREAVLGLFRHGDDGRQRARLEVGALERDRRVPRPPRRARAPRAPSRAVEDPHGVKARALDLVLAA